MNPCIYLLNTLTIYGGEIMITAIQYLDKIEWDARLTPAEFEIFYLDKDRLVQINYCDIIREKDNKFNFIVRQDDEEVYIPYHRIRQIRQNGEIIWQR